MNKLSIEQAENLIEGLEGAIYNVQLYNFKETPW